MLFGFKTQVTLAALGYAIFGVGVEIAGITVSKIIVKWFKGKEMALAMGLEMATARIGTTLAMVLTVPLADFFGSTDESGTFHTNIPAPILFCLIMLCVGTIAFSFILSMIRSWMLLWMQRDWNRKNRSV